MLKKKKKKKDIFFLCHILFNEHCPKLQNLIDVKACASICYIVARNYNLIFLCINFPLSFDGQIRITYMIGMYKRAE
jgi:hypothetical protein